MTEIAPRRVSPFGHPGLNACVPLPLAYRSLPRPSSPPCAQASSTCLRSLDHQVRWPSRARAHTTRNCANTISMMIRSMRRDPKITSHQVPRSTPLPLSNSELRVKDWPRLRHRGRPKKIDRERLRETRLREGFRARRLPVLALLARSEKEVIQPQVPLRLPCYDFAPVTALAFGGLVCCQFRHRLRALAASMA